MIHPDYKQKIPEFGIFDYTCKIGLNGKGTWILDSSRDTRTRQNIVSTMTVVEKEEGEERIR